MSYINKHLKQAASVILSIFLSAGMTGVSGIYAEEEPEEPEISETSEETAAPEEEAVQEISIAEEIVQETEEESEQPAEAEEEPVISEKDSETEEIIEETAAVTEEALLADVSTWSALQDAFNAGGNVTLRTDIIASDSDTVLTVPMNTTVSLNLNGFMISRNLTSPRENGNDSTFRKSRK